MDIIAYYLSEYDIKAFDLLGFKTRASGFRVIAEIFGRKEGYLRRLRDEYDAVTSSHRNGQKNRHARSRIIETNEYLSVYSFEELSNIVKSLIQNAAPTTGLKSDIEIIKDMTEEELEHIINAKDSMSRIEYRLSETKPVRVYDHSIISCLKALYKGQCQLCGCNPAAVLNCDICEAHHIEYFSESQNNDASNILIICPNHHRIIHKLNPVFNKEKLEYVFASGVILKVKNNYHILKMGDIAG